VDKATVSYLDSSCGFVDLDGSTRLGANLVDADT
jgi:hypothetical protein